MPIAHVNGTSLWYDIQGEGHPIIFFPGLGLDHNYYRFGEPLIRPHARTILVDPRGIGGSQKDAPSSVTYTAELWADDFAALLRHLGITHCDILGSSLGGSMAQAFALRHPDLVRSLIVVGAFSELDRAMEINFTLRKKIIAKLGMGEEIADFMGLFTMTREFMATDAGYAVMKANQANVRANSPELYTAFIDAVLAWGKTLPHQAGETLNTQAIKAIRAPTLCIAGDNDYFIPASFTRKIADQIPGATYVEVASGGHIPFIEKPRETAALVLEFLAALK
jgi:pimeloyl-ACP methyl ester carboxylesterase